MKQHVLWIHGWGMSPEIWRDDAQRFPEFEHHFVSFRECAATRDFRSAMLAILQDNPGRWTLAGWSMGGMLALELWLNEEIRNRYGINDIVLIGSTLRFTDKDRRKGWPVRIVERMKSQLLIDPEQTLQQFRSSMWSASEQEGQNAFDAKEGRTAVDAGIANDTDFSPQGLAAGLDYLIQTDLTAQWEQAVRQHGIGVNDGARLLWIHGSDDPVCPIGAIPELPAEQKLVLESAGHAPFVTQKERFYGQLRSFFHDGR